ncbi:phage scaffolding protein [Clostridium sp.]|uniref:phage scaffolding protein n=1 Tax=Clostridium sp. TaxID=1506 RepID=UPI0034641EEA
MPKLNEILGEAYAQIPEDVQNKYKDIDLVDSSTYADKDKFDALNEQLKTANTTIEDLKKNNTDNETLQSKIGEYETKVTDYEKQIQNMQFNYAVDGALKSANVRNAKAIKALLNMENVKLDGENILGLTDQLEALKKSDSYLFDTTVTGSDPTDGKSNPAPQDTTDLRSALAQKYQ